jgi:hypothetical protein
MDEISRQPVLRLWHGYHWLLLVRFAVRTRCKKLLHIKNQAERKSYRVIEASTKISKEGLGGQVTCGRVRTPAGSS